MLKFKTSCAVLAYLSSNLLNEVGLSLFRYFEVGLRVCDIVVKKFTFAISSPDEFLSTICIALHIFVKDEDIESSNLVGRSTVASPSPRMANQPEDPERGVVRSRDPFNFWVL